MRVFNLLVVILLMLSVQLQHAVADDGGWELARDREGIRVFTREVSGSKFREFRGETVINAELNQLMALLDDTPGLAAWMYGARNPLLLQKIGPLERYHYLVNDFPWPAADRELIMRNLIRQNPETRVTTVTLEGVPVEELPDLARSRVPAGSGAVRVTELQGFYRLTPLSDAQTQVVFQLHLDPVGKLPASMVNALIVDNPFETLRAMAVAAVEPRYRCFKPF